MNNLQQIILIWVSLMPVKLKSYRLRFAQLGVLFAVLLSQTLWAGGFQINPHSVSGMGRAYAGEAAMMDNASVIARNPAAMSFFDKQQKLSIVAHYIAPDVDISGSNIAPPFSSEASNNNVVPSTLVPGIFYVSPLNQYWAFGLALTTHFGLSTDYSTSFGATEHTNQSSIDTLYLNPSFAYKVSESLSFALGLNYILADSAFSTTVSNVVSDRILSDEALSLSVGETLIDMTSDGTGLSWNLGLMWKVNETSHLGLRYMTAADIDTDAIYRNYSLADNSIVETQGTLRLNLPQVTELAYRIQLIEKWMVAASYQKTAWSSFQNISVDGILIKEANWQDAVRYSLGSDYQLSRVLTLRFGLASDESPVPNGGRLLAAPDTDKMIYSFGTTFNLAKGSLDFGIVYIKGDSGSISESFETLDSRNNFFEVSEFEGEVKDLEAWVYSLGYNVSF